MNILLLLIPLSLILLGAAIWAFVWAVRGGQYEDLDTPALDILVDDDLRSERRQSPAQRVTIETVQSVPPRDEG
jgi:cbb3-type cytochrome oxidase maturation protein